MIYCNENENDNEKTNYINKYTNIQHIACLGRTMPLCNKQYLSKI